MLHWLDAGLINTVFKFISCSLLPGPGRVIEVVYFSMVFYQYPYYKELSREGQ